MWGQPAVALVAKEREIVPGQPWRAGAQGYAIRPSLHTGIAAAQIAASGFQRKIPAIVHGDGLSQRLHLPL